MHVQFVWCCSHPKKDNKKTQKKTNKFLEFFVFVWRFTKPIAFRVFNRLWFVMFFITFAFAQVCVLLLSGSCILEPNLCDTFAEASIQCNTLQILSIRIAINFKITLQHFELLFGECCSYTFDFLL